MVIRKAKKLDKKTINCNKIQVHWVAREKKLEKQPKAKNAAKMVSPRKAKLAEALRANLRRRKALPKKGGR